jgi:hypothetical protein
VRRYLLVSILSLSIFAFSSIAHASGFTDGIINPFRVVFVPIAAFVHRAEMAFGIVTTPRSLTAASTLSTPPPQPVVRATTTPWTFSTIVQTTKAKAIAQPAKREKTASPSPHQTSDAITKGVVLGASTSDGVVTQSELQTAIEQASNALRQLIYANAGTVGQGQYSSGGYTNSIALTNRIDQLSGTKLSNITVNSVSGLTAADIPTNIVAVNYLPLAGGTLSGDLTLTGNLTVTGAQTLSGTITIPYLSATSTSVDSTFVRLSATNATSTSLFATLGHFTTGIIDTLTSTAATITNLITTTITGTNATFTNATTTNASSTNAFSTNLTAINATTTDFAALGKSYFAGNVGIGTTSPSQLLTVGNNNQFTVDTNGNVAIAGTLSLPLGSATLPTVLTASGGAVRATSVPNYVDLWGYNNLTNATWSGGVVTITTGNTTPQGRYYAPGDLVNIQNINPTGYNGTFRINTVTASTTFTYLLASNPGTYVSGGFSSIEPNVLIGNSSPIVPSLVVVGNPNSVPLTFDPNLPILEVVGGDGNMRNNSVSILADGHSISINFGNVQKQFSNGFVDYWTSEHMLGWTSSISSTPGTSLNVDTGIARNAAGVVEINNGTVGTYRDLRLRAINPTSGNLGIGTSTPYSKLTIWGIDTAASTAALTIANSASTTELQVFDNGNATLAGTLTQNSDQRLKKNIQPLNASSTLALINALSPVTFTWIDPDKGSNPQLGFIAQDVQKIFPQLVSTTSPTALTPDGTLGLNYLGLIAPLVEAVQQLSAGLSSLTARVSSVESAIASLANSFTTHQLNADELCLQGTCITKSQLQALLGSQPSVQISAPTPVTISGTTTPPSINVAGNNPAHINVGDPYSDLGVIVTDNQGHDLSYRTFINSVLSGNILIDTSHVATDTIDYVATDTWGNTATATRTVIIEAANP